MKEVPIVRDDTIVECRLLDDKTVALYPSAALQESYLRNKSVPA